MSQSNDGGSKKPSLVEKFSITTDEAKQLSVVNLLMRVREMLGQVVMPEPKKIVVVDR